MLEEVRCGRSLFIELTPGSPDGKLVTQNVLAVLVHGACANRQQWRGQVPALKAAGVTVLTFDALGCGQSEKPQDWYAYQPEQLYQDLVALFDQKIQGYKKVIVVGHSFGTALAMRLAAEKPAHIAGVVLVGAYVPLEKQPKPRLFSLQRWLFYLPNWVLSWLQPELTEGFLKAAFHASTQKSQPELIAQERKYSNANPPYMFKAFHRQMGELATPEQYAAWAAGVSAPARVIYGDSDRITPLFPNSSRLMRHLQHAELTVVKEASHQVMQEKPESVNAVLLDLLAENTSK